MKRVAKGYKYSCLFLTNIERKETNAQKYILVKCFTHTQRAHLRKYYSYPHDWKVTGS